MRAREFITKRSVAEGLNEDATRAEAQAAYMQGQCMILAVAINQLNPKRYPIGYIWEYNMSAGAPDVQLDDDEWDNLSPQEQQEISKDISRHSVVHAYVRDRDTGEYIDARGRHKTIPNLWGRLGQTRFEEFPGTARELIDITAHGDWDEVGDQVSFKRGQPAFDSLAGPAGIKRAQEYAVKYLGVEESKNKLRIGNIVRAVVDGKRVQGEVIGISSDYKEVELWLSGVNDFNPITANVRDIEPVSEQGVISEYKATGRVGTSGPIKLGNLYKNEWPVINTPISNQYEVRIDNNNKEYPEYYFYNKETGACVGQFALNASADSSEDAAGIVKPGVMIVEPHITLASEVQGKGLGSLIYRTFLSDGNRVFATHSHSKGAGALWNKVATGDIISVLYNAETGQVVSPDSKESQFAVRILGHKNKLKQGVSENFADGKVKYAEPQFDVEWEEAERYPEFRKIGKEAWIELAKKGKAVTIKSAKGINNTDAADPDSFKSLDAVKQGRALDQLKSGTVEMPIVAVYSDGWKELIGGNTRLTAMLAQTGRATVWAFKVPDEVAELAENFADGKVKGKSRPGLSRSIPRWH